MWFACIEISAFFVGAISAWYILRGRDSGFFLKSFKVAVIAAIVAAPMQIYLGDGSGLADYQLQPEKLAAMEAHWDTNLPAQGAPWHILAWPDVEHGRNKWEISIPSGLSILTTHSLKGKVTGFNDLPRSYWPPILIPFYAFRIMAVIGILLFSLVLWTLWTWHKGHFADAKTGCSRALLSSWVAAFPLSYIALETGWLVREVGRQPWIINRMMQTKDAATGIHSAAVGTSLLIYIALYGTLLVFFLLCARHLLRKGPDMDEPVETGGEGS